MSLIGTRCDSTHEKTKLLSLQQEKNYSPSAYIDSTQKNPLGRTLVKLRVGCHNYMLKQVGTTKSLSMKGYVPSVVVIKLLLLDCQR